jgi:hypothetical protein
MVSPLAKVVLTMPQKSASALVLKLRRKNNEAMRILFMLEQRLQRIGIQPS